LNLKREKLVSNFAISWFQTLLSNSTGTAVYIQRTCEDLEYLHLLYDAIDRPTGINRMTALAVGLCTLESS
jgi:hypothetical protein